MSSSSSLPESSTLTSFVGLSSSTSELSTTLRRLLPTPFTATLAPCGGWPTSGALRFLSFGAPPLSGAPLAAGSPPAGSLTAAAGSFGAVEAAASVAWGLAVCLWAFAEWALALWPF